MSQTPLRAFLMLRSSNGVWTVTVCRDLGAVMDAWKSRRETETDVGVLHIGFDRPPSKAFEDIAARYLGRMLLTASAKHGLPSFFLASGSPIDTVRDCPVFLGLRGWGYMLDEESVPQHCAEKAIELAPPVLPRGWVAQYFMENPSVKQAILSAGIFDENSYYNLEAQIDRLDRHRLGVFRVYYLVGGHCEDLCEFARAAPPWLAEREMESLNFSVRAQNVFRVHEIKRVEDLSRWSSENLLGLQNFGRKSLNDTVEVLRAALIEGPVDLGKVGPVGPISDDSRLLTDIRRSLLSLTDRQRDILVRRIGFERRQETLQEIADNYGVSRERIRQIEASSIAKLIRVAIWDDILEQKIARHLIGRDFPLPVAGVEAIDPWFEDISSLGTNFKNIVDAVCGRRIFILQIDGIDYFSLINQDTWEKAISESRALLSSGVGQDWNQDYARSLVGHLLPNNATEFTALLWDKCCRPCHFSCAEDGSRILKSYGRGAEQLVEAVLEESKKTITLQGYSEYSKLANWETY